MINLLPEQKKKELFREYAFRVTVVAGVFLFLLEAIALLSFAPAYLAVTGRLMEDQRELETLRAVAPKNTESGALSESAKRDIVLATAAPFEAAWSVTLAAIDRVRASGIEVYALGFEMVGTIPQIQLSGKARDRDTLTAFRRALREHPEFEQVDIPAPAFVREKDIEWSARIILKKPA